MNSFSVEGLRQRLEAAAGGAGGAAAQRYCVAFSGGLDSTVLLVAMGQLAERSAVGGLRAIHVHHGLHPDADDWAAACAARCRELGVPLDVAQVDARAAPGESPEARARELRYQALEERLAPAEVLLTAQHADDQLETVLIQLLRGAGPAGLAAMPADTAFGAGRHQRPLLACTRASLEAWAREEGLSDWIEDPANRARQFSRNHLRHDVLPAIRAHWPGAAAAVSRAARHCAEAAGLLDELAAVDAAACVDGEALSLAAMQALSPARRRNLVRWQCRCLGLPVPDERRLGTLLDQLFDAAGDRHPEVHWPGVSAQRHADRLWLLPEAALQPVPDPLDWPDPRVPLELGAGLGRLSLRPTVQGGLRAEALASAPWRVAFRGGGERLDLPGRAGSRALKKLMNEAAVPPWLRLRMPLVEIGGALAAVGELWIAEAWCAPPDHKGWRLAWEGCALPGRDAFVVGGQAF